MDGVIRNVNLEGGFGFLCGDDDKIDRFFHKTVVGKGVNFNTLKRGDRVRFAVDDDGPKGPRARDIELA